MRPLWGPGAGAGLGHFGVQQTGGAPDPAKVCGSRAFPKCGRWAGTPGDPRPQSLMF